MTMKDLKPLSAFNPLAEHPRIRELLAEAKFPEVERPNKAAARGLLRDMFDSQVAGRSGESVARAAKAEFETKKSLRSEVAKQGLGVKFDGPVAWPFETWIKALSLVRATPEKFGQLFEVVTREALAKKEFEVAREMVDGLATLRAGASLVARGKGEYFLAHRSAGRSQGTKPLETQEGLLQAVSIGLRSCALALIESQQKAALAYGEGPPQAQLEASYREIRRLRDLAATDSRPEVLRALSERMKEGLQQLESAVFSFGARRRAAD